MNPDNSVETIAGPMKGKWLGGFQNCCQISRGVVN